MGDSICEFVRFLVENSSWLLISCDPVMCLVVACPLYLSVLFPSMLCRLPFLSYVTLQLQLWHCTTICLRRTFSRSKAPILSISCFLADSFMPNDWSWILRAEAFIVDRSCETKVRSVSRMKCWATSLRVMLDNSCCFREEPVWVVAAKPLSESVIVWLRRSRF